MLYLLSYSLYGGVRRNRAFASCASNKRAHQLHHNSIKSVRETTADDLYAILILIINLRRRSWNYNLNRKHQSKTRSDS